MKANIIGVLTLSACLLATACEQQEAPPQSERPPQAVTVVTLRAQDVTLTSTLPGRVVASAVAEVRPQVDGIIIERLFEEGSHVEIGAPMYRIDADSYEASVAASRASVAEARAQLSATSKKTKRVETLIKRGVTSEQALENAEADSQADAAALQVALANLKAAEIDLKRTTINAPLSGEVGLSLTTQGALVTAGQSTPLAVIRTLDPVLVDVTQSAEELLEWRRGQTLGKLDGADTEVRLVLADGTEYPFKGELTAAEPHVAELTGVVTLRMQFDNPDRLLLPGMYVRVEVPQGIAKNVVLAPQQGVTRNRRGNPIAYVVNADNVVEPRDLTVAQAYGNKWIVTKGLADGDRLIVEGLQKIAPQMKVAPEEKKAAPPDAAGKGPAQPVTN